MSSLTEEGGQEEGKSTGELRERSRVMAAGGTKEGAGSSDMTPPGGMAHKWVKATPQRAINSEGKH